MSSSGQQTPDIFVTSSSQHKMEDSTAETSVDTDTVYLLSSSDIIARTATNLTANVISNENHGLVGIAPPCWENKGKCDDNCSTDSSGTHSTMITANRKTPYRDDLLDISNREDFMDLANRNDDLLNISLNIFENYYDHRDDSSISLPSIDDILPPRADLYSALHTIFSSEESDTRYESESTKQSSLGSSMGSRNSGTDLQIEAGESEDSSGLHEGNDEDERRSPHSKTSEHNSPSSTPPRDQFGLPLLPFSYELFKKIRARRRIVDQQLMEEEKQLLLLKTNSMKEADIQPVSTEACDELMIEEEKKTEETTVAVDHRTHLWHNKLMIELISGDPATFTLQLPGQRSKGRTVDKDSSNQPTLPSRKANDLLHKGHPSPWAVLHSSSRKFMMIRSRSVPILSFFGAPPRRNSPRRIFTREEIIKQFVEDYNKHVEESITPDESARRLASNRKRASPQSPTENRYHEVRERALFQLEESKRRLKEYKRML